MFRYFPQENEGTFNAESCSNEITNEVKRTKEIEIKITGEMIPDEYILGPVLGTRKSSVNVFNIFTDL